MEIIENKYRIEKPLAKGGFAEVFLASVLKKPNSDETFTEIKTETKVAIKRISIKDQTSSSAMVRIENEIDAMSKLRHPNIVGYYETIKHDDYWYIVMEYCECGTLADVLAYLEQETVKQNINFNREAHVYYYMNQIKEGLRYILLNNYVHRDIKSANILIQKSPQNLQNLQTELAPSSQLSYNLDQKFVVKIADFGLTKTINDFSEKQDLLSTMCGSPLTMAPEMISGHGYTSKADLWSIGVVMYQLMFSSYPTYGQNCQELFKNIIDANKTINFHLHKDFEPECFSLVSGLLNKIPDKRLSWDDFFSHKWFKKWSKQNLSAVLPMSTRRFSINQPSQPINISTADAPNLSKSTTLSICAAFGAASMSMSSKESNSTMSKSSELSGSRTSNDSSSSIKSGGFGESNLSKMRISFAAATTKAKPTGTYSDYPSSYPPTHTYATYQTDSKRTNLSEKISSPRLSNNTLSNSTLQAPTSASSASLSRSRIFSQSVRKTKQNPSEAQGETHELSGSISLSSIIEPRR
jgi:serine/threonine protein kinase